MQKPFPSAIVHLSDYGVKVLKILEMFVSHVQHKITSRVGAGRHHPVAVRGQIRWTQLRTAKGSSPLGSIMSVSSVTSALRTDSWDLSPAKNASSAYKTEMCCIWALKCPVRCLVCT